MLTITYAKCHIKAPNVECRHAEYRGNKSQEYQASSIFPVLFYLLLLLNVIMLNVVMASVIAPVTWLCKTVAI
jgi:hypothetical protein